jgi:hypothetical protein
MAWSLGPSRAAPNDRRAPSLMLGAVLRGRLVLDPLRNWTALLSGERGCRQGRASRPAEMGCRTYVFKIRTNTQASADPAARPRRDGRCWSESSPGGIPLPLLAREEMGRGLGGGRGGGAQVASVPAARWAATGSRSSRPGGWPGCRSRLAPIGALGGVPENPGFVVGWKPLISFAAAWRVCLYRQGVDFRHIGGNDACLGGHPAILQCCNSFRVHLPRQDEGWQLILHAARCRAGGPRSAARPVARGDRWAPTARGLTPHPSRTRIWRGE